MILLNDSVIYKQEKEKNNLEANESFNNNNVEMMGDPETINRQKTTSNEILSEEKDISKEVLEKQGEDNIQFKHVTENIIQLSQVLNYYAQTAYKELSDSVQCLLNSKNLHNSNERKRNFLKTIISIRQKFVKIYTLERWAYNAEDVSKFIDILFWLRRINFCYDLLAYQMNTVCNVIGARLPNSDLMTCLEIFFDKRPQLPSYNYIKQPKLSSKKVLNMLNELNLILISRLAFIDDLPKLVSQNYKVKDGKIYISILNNFEISLTVMNDIIVKDFDKYKSSPFLFVDFKFLFGCNNDDYTITYTDYEPIHINHSFIKKLEISTNKISYNFGINGIYNYLFRLSVYLKFYLLHQQLIYLSTVNKWENNIKFNINYDELKIHIIYWTNNFLTKHYNFVIEIISDIYFNLSYNWYLKSINKSSSNFKVTDNEKVLNDDSNHNFIFNTNDFNNDFFSKNHNELNIKHLLNFFLETHSKNIMEKIYKKLSDFYCNQNDLSAYNQNKKNTICLTNYDIVIELSPQKSVIFSIDPCSGTFHFNNPSMIELKFTDLINSPLIKIRSLMLFEDDLVNHIVVNLLNLKSQFVKNKLQKKFNLTYWATISMIKIDESQYKKLLKFVQNPYLQTKINDLAFYRRENWPKNWTIIALVDEITYNVYFWISKIKFIKNKWNLCWVKFFSYDDFLSNENIVDVELKFLKTDQIRDKTIHYNQLNFSFFNNLSIYALSIIFNNIFFKELIYKKIKFLKVKEISHFEDNFNLNHLTENKVDSSLNQFNNQSSTTSSDVKFKKSNKFLKINLILFNDGSLFSVSKSSTCLVLIINFIEYSNHFEVEFDLFGILRNLSLQNFSDQNMTIDFKKNFFKIFQKFNLSSQVLKYDIIDFDFNENKINSNNCLYFFNQIFDNLNNLKKLISILDHIEKNKFSHLSYSTEKISVKGCDYFNDLVIFLPTKNNKSFKIFYENKNNDTVCMNEISILFHHFNKFLSKINQTNYSGDKSRDEINDIYLVIELLKYLRDISPIFKFIDKVKREDSEKDKKNTEISNFIIFEVKILTLTYLQFLFYYNCTDTTLSKKNSHDKIVINLKLKKNKFSSNNSNLIKISFKNNFSFKNLKYKKLFESVFKLANDFNNDLKKKQSHSQNENQTNNNDLETIIKLNYDFLIQTDIVEMFLIKIYNYFIGFQETNTDV